MTDKFNRPENCRNRLRDEGKSHPRSGCAHCHDGGMFGCPFEGNRTKPVMSEPPPPTKITPELIESTITSLVDKWVIEMVDLSTRFGKSLETLCHDIDTSEMSEGMKTTLYIRLEQYVKSKEKEIAKTLAAARGG